MTGEMEVAGCIRFHEETGTMVTLTGVLPEGRFGVMDIDGSMIRSFREKSRDDMGWGDRFQQTLSHTGNERHSIK